MTRREVSFIVSSNFSSRILRRTVGLGRLRGLIVLAGFLLLVVLAALVLAGAGVFRLARLSWLERRNRELEAEFAKVTLLRGRLAELEEERNRMAEMLGVELTPPPVDWGSAADDSSELPSWVTDGEWGARPVPVLIPVERYVVSRGFEPGHEAVDLAAQAGAPVRAVADGVARQVGTDSVFGQYVLLVHGRGYESYYGHLAGFAVASGDTVRAGGVIGTVGSTGVSSAPHLHLEIRRDGVRIDPTELLAF